jgi:phenylacetate-CoA ligase
MVPLPADLDNKRAVIRQRQWDKLHSLLQTVLPMNRFWSRRLAGLPMDSLQDFLTHCPFLSKRMLMEDRENFPPYGTNLTFPIENYTRFCQTSGTSGKPLAWLDSRDDWRVMLDCWEVIFNKAGLEPGEDRVFFPFSFGPFLGFWTAFEAATRMGCLVIPGGGMSSVARLQTMLEHGVTIICCTPTYAQHLGEVKAADPVLAASDWSLKTIIVAGEPGGSSPTVRARIEAHWPGVNVFDHHGLTEVGPVSYQDPKAPGRLLVLEEFYLVEVVDPASGQEVLAGEEGELVITTLRRMGCPLLRYKTGDIVRKGYSRLARLSFEGGVSGRLDDMVLVRGVNVFPSAVDAIVRKFPQVQEYQVREERRGALLELHLLIEPILGLTQPQLLDLREHLEAALRDALSLRVPVKVLRQGALPRFEFKARRWIKESRRGEVPS